MNFVAGLGMRIMQSEVLGGGRLSGHQFLTPAEAKLLIQPVALCRLQNELRPSDFGVVHDTAHQPSPKSLPLVVLSYDQIGQPREHRKVSHHTGKTNLFTIAEQRKTE